MKVTPEGKVKVLDFGLAKAFAGGPHHRGYEQLAYVEPRSDDARRNSRHCGVHESPEQARGKAVDKRTDIWAFGCVLYELLTGKQAFHGEDITEILAAVVMKEPAFDALPANISPSIRILLQRCLRKDRRQRTPDAATIRIEIEDAIAAPKEVGATQAAPTSMGKLLFAVGAVAAALALIAVAALWGWWRATRPVERPLVRLDVDLGPDVSLGSLSGTGAIISPDGTRLVYVSQGRLFTRRLDQPKATELVGTQGALAPFFSPDGLWVAFFSQGKLKKISVDGGAAVTLCDATIRAAAAGAEMEQSSSRQMPGVPYTEFPRVGEHASRSALSISRRAKSRNAGHRCCRGLRAVLFTSSTHGYNYDDADIIVYSMASGQRKIGAARRLVCPLFAQRPSDLCESGHAFCCPIRSGSTGGTWNARAGT